MALSNRQVAESYWRAEAERDVDKVLSHYHETAVFCPPGQRLVGHAQIRTFYDNSKRLFPGLEVGIVGEVTDGARSAFEWSAVLIDAAGGRFPLAGANVVRIEDGKYLEVHAYFDPTVLS